jgi:hypothetical protein
MYNSNGRLQLVTIGDDVYDGENVWIDAHTTTSIAAPRVGFVPPIHPALNKIWMWH